MCHMELIAEIATCSRCSRQDSLTLSTSSPLTICDQSTRAMTGEIQVLVQIPQELQALADRLCAVQSRCRLIEHRIVRWVY